MDRIPNLMIAFSREVRRVIKAIDPLFPKKKTEIVESVQEGMISETLNMEKLKAILKEFNQLIDASKFGIDHRFGHRTVIFQIAFDGT